MLEPRKQSKRIQTSILNAAEKKVLVWLANRQPKWMTSDILTFIGFLGALTIAAGYVLTNYNPAWIWLATAGFAINWYGDSLDGTYARVHHQQRPIYGYYLDHNMDGINEFIMFLGAGLSPILNTEIALMVYAAYMLLSLYVSISAHVINEFKLTYAKMGPTELRIIVMIVNTIMFFNWEKVTEKAMSIDVFNRNLMVGAFDWIALGLFGILIIIYLYNFIKDACKLAKLDPLKREEGDK